MKGGAGFVHLVQAGVEVSHHNMCRLDRFESTCQEKPKQAGLGVVLSEVHPDNRDGPEVRGNEPVTVAVR